MSGNHSEDVFGEGDDSCLAMECSYAQTQYHQNVLFFVRFQKWMIYIFINLHQIPLQILQDTR